MEIKAELIAPPPVEKRVKIELDLSYEEAKAFRAFLGGMNTTKVRAAIASSGHPSANAETARRVEQGIWSKLCGIPGLG